MQMKLQKAVNALSSVRDIKIAGTENGYVVLDIGSGKYHFAIK